jgi:hypothetical protein
MLDPISVPWEMTLFDVSILPCYTREAYKTARMVANQ